jgi:transglutaminase-like putative cysteine protease
VAKIVERRAGWFRPVPVTHDQLAYYRRPTDLTAADERIAAIAGELAARTHNGVALAEQISDYVAGAMRYGSGATAVTTTAAEALAIGQGLCQDYAHIMLALCRSAGVAARYVSGHMLGEGGSHAWVEALLPSPDQSGVQILAFDPTNRRRPNLGYTTVATGRDYSDVPPTSGSFTAPYGGCLSFSKRAGLTLVEYSDAEVMVSGC